MPRGSELYLGDILDSIRKIERYTAGMRFEDFAADELVQDGVCRNLAILGEAVKKLPEEERALAPSIEWRKIAGLRDVLVHEYAHVDLEIVWDVVRNKLPTLETAATNLREQLTK